jgi:hypothetical protein
MIQYYTVATQPMPLYLYNKLGWIMHYVFGFVTQYFCKCLISLIPLLIQARQAWNKIPFYESMYSSLKLLVLFTYYTTLVIISVQINWF